MMRSRGKDIECCHLFGALSDSGLINSWIDQAPEDQE